MPEGITYGVIDPSLGAAIRLRILDRVTKGLQKSPDNRLSRRGVYLAESQGAIPAAHPGSGMESTGLESRRLHE